MFGLPEIAVSMAGFVCPGRDDARTRIDAISSLGVRGIVLDAMLPGLRARELTHSAHRDIAATLRRAGLELAGIDLWIPPEHFASGQHVQRASDALQSTIYMASQIKRLVGGESTSLPVVSVFFPLDMFTSLRKLVQADADAYGCKIADHRVLGDDEKPLFGGGAGIDPVMYLDADRSPAKAVIHAGEHLRSARLSDTDGIGRCDVGKGKLDLTGYVGAMVVAKQEWVTLDVRKVDEPMIAAQNAITRWRDAGTL